ncbi:glycosyltransferase family 1 protein [Komagataeibacter rhaeticus]|uniref:glycosyltransferase family 4 protein n=1 Tax=Komagataeibacter rhaeticus TaxID=215221 RepID=UPI000DA072CE|nr:glycosyltransferase family 4 protein [Komagataeibacter rhaeticus]MBL7240793.1 glycosyltransferase family 4 protein [Komagataeibacter rhaeticus]PYD53919.1 glycosyltransferase family 1 protein [Komagataeibacter rhaeticus]GBQ17306.1 glycosyltransferase [Komagataeibacter rhaeticus DSM 16663]
MKILEITNVDFSMRQFLFPLMQALREQGHDVTGACAEGPLLDAMRADGLRVVGVPLSRTLSPRAQWRAWRALVRLIRAEKPDLVHAHMPISGLLGRFAAWRCGVPCVAYTCHGFLFNQPGSRLRRVAALVLEWLAGKVTDIYLTVSEEEARDARRLGIHRHATGIGNGRDPATFHPDPAARARLRAQQGVGEEQVVILAVSRLVRSKGYPELLEAMRAVPGNAVLWIVGTRLPSDRGADLAPCFAAARAALGPRLVFLGYREDVAAIMAAADMFVLPSHFEGLPMSVIEAMLCGLPVISTDISGPREQVVAGETGLLVPPANVPDLAAALDRLVRDGALRRRMGAAGRARALARYTQAAVMARTVALLTACK